MPPERRDKVLNARQQKDIIIPIKADKNALDGMEELDDIIQEIRPYNEKLESVRCLVTMYTKDIDVIKGEVLRNSKYDVFTTHIRHNKKVTAWTYENGQSLLETTPRSAATRDYKNLVLEYMGKEGVKMFEEFKETLRRVLLEKYSIGFIDGYKEGYTDGIKTGGFADGYKAGYEQRKRER